MITLLKALRGSCFIAHFQSFVVFSSPRSGILFVHKPLYLKAIDHTHIERENIEKRYASLNLVAAILPDLHFTSIFPLQNLTHLIAREPRGKAFPKT